MKKQEIKMSSSIYNNLAPFERVLHGIMMTDAYEGEVEEIDTSKNTIHVQLVNWFNPDDRLSKPFKSDIMARYGVEREGQKFYYIFYKVLS